MEICFKDYVLKKKIGSGSFGDVWLGKGGVTPGKHKSGEKEDVAIKLEEFDKENLEKSVYKETKILQCLHGKSRRVGLW